MADSRHRRKDILHPSRVGRVQAEEDVLSFPGPGSSLGHVGLSIQAQLKRRDRLR